MNVSFVQKLKFDVILFAFSILVSFVGGLVGPLKTDILVMVLQKNSTDWMNTIKDLLV